MKHLSITFLLLTSIGLANASEKSGVIFIEASLIKENILKEIEDKDSLEGTGFLINTAGYVVTALHVVEKEDWETTSIKGYFSPSDNQKVYSFELEYKDVKNDVAVLKVKGGGISHTPLCINRSAKFSDYNGKVINLAGYENSNSYSVVSGIVTEQEKGKWISTIPNGKPGMSGGPIFDPETKEVIGVYLEKIRGVQNQRKQAAINTIINLLERDKIELEHLNCASHKCNIWKAAEGKIDFGWRRLSGASGRRLGAWYDLSVKKSRKHCDVSITFQGRCKSNHTFIGAQGTFRLYLGEKHIKSASCDCGPRDSSTSRKVSVDLDKDDVRRYSPSDIDLTRDYK